MSIKNVRDNELFQAAGITPDKGAKSWAKIITGVDPSQRGGYAILGTFVSGKYGQDIDSTRESLFLLHGRTGGTRNPTYHYRVVKVTPAGDIVPTSIVRKMNGEKAGWADVPFLDEINKLLGSPKPAPATTSTPTVTLTAGAAAALSALRPAYQGASDGDIAHAAFELLGALLTDPDAAAALFAIMQNQGGTVPEAVTTAVKAFASNY